MVEVELIDEKTGEVFTVVELEDDIVEKIQSLGMTIEEGISKAFTDMIVEYKKDPDGFVKRMKVEKDKK